MIIPLPRGRAAWPVLGFIVLVALTHVPAVAQARPVHAPAIPARVPTLSDDATMIRYEPCRDGRVQWGRPVNCEEEMSRRGYRRGHAPAFPDDYHPCRDGRVQWGRPVDCEKLFDRPHPHWRRHYWDD